MVNSLLYIVWNPSVYLVKLGGFGIRWYSFLWCCGLIFAYLTVQRLYKQQGIEAKKFEPLFIYCFLGILIGARLGHCLLYQPGYFLSHPIEMFLPVQQDAWGQWHVTGYQGLASHGGTLGLMIALWLYVRKYKVNLMRVLDNIAIATPVTACFIRLGNLMNSEIVGKVTNSPLGFIFVRNGDTAPRYPAQLYEAMYYLLLFFIGLWLYNTEGRRKVGTGYFFGWALTGIFSFRFLVEFIKEVQEPWEQAMVHAIGLNQGQLLSIPFIVVGVYCWMGGKYCRKLGEQ